MPRLSLFSFPAIAESYLTRSSSPRWHYHRSPGQQQGMCLPLTPYIIQAKEAVKSEKTPVPYSLGEKCLTDGSLHTHTSDLSLLAICLPHTYQLPPRPSQAAGSIRLLCWFMNSLGILRCISLLLGALKMYCTELVCLENVT